MNDHPSIADTPFGRWRDIKSGGDKFVEKYLESRTEEESSNFNARKNMTPDPATASSAVDEVINSFAARMDVNRTGGSKEYQEVVNGNLGGVDKKGTDMDTYLLKETIPELCYMSKFGWIVQNYTEPGDPRKFPYIVPLKAEQIRNWTYLNNELVALLISDTASIIDPLTGFSGEEREVFRRFLLLPNKTVETRLQNEDDEEIDPITLEPGSSTEILKIDEIPVVLFELTNPLLKRIDKMQIAVLNMESADIDWLRTANITVYVEQNQGFSFPTMEKSEDQTLVPDKNRIILGSSRGRSYGPGMNQPDYISPSAEPIRASMEKQKELAAKCREILKANLSEMKLPSAESLSMLGQGMEAGLSVIGVVLNLGEIKFSRIFHKFQGKDDESNVSYPTKYELRTESDRLEKAKSIKEVQKTVGSNIAKRYLEVQVIQTLLEGKMPIKDYDAAVKEVMDSEFCIYEPDALISLVEAGILSKDLASKSIGAPDNDSAIATAEHLERIVAVKESQTSGLTDTNPDPAFSEKIKKEAATNEVPNT